MKRSLIVASVLLAAVCIGSASAYFTGQAQVPENVIRAGAVAVSAEPTQSALSIESLAPGQSVTKPLTVYNTGSLPCSIVVTGAKKAGITDFYEALSCTVTNGGTTLYSGPLSALKTQQFSLQAGAKGDLDVAVALPADAGNALAGDYVKISLYVDAEQTH